MAAAIGCDLGYVRNAGVAAGQQFEGHQGRRGITAPEQVLNTARQRPANPNRTADIKVSHRRPAFGRT